MWEFCLLGFATLVGGLCYCYPYRCMTLVAQGRHAARTWFYSTTSGGRWEGSRTGWERHVPNCWRREIRGDGCDVVPDWLVCFRVFTTVDGVDAYVPRDACSLPSRKTLPFFQTVVCLNNGEVCDVSSDISMFAYEGNDIGGLSFWRWFLLRFTSCEIADSVKSIRVLDALTFKERDLDMSTSLRL